MRLPQYMLLSGFVIAALLHAVPPVQADEEAAPYTHVAAGPDGRCYAKSIPKIKTGGVLATQAGITRIFRVREDNDMLVDEYDWYASRIYVKCAGVGSGMDSIRIAVVRRGPRHRGAAVSDDHLALGFYIGGEERKTYSTADIAATAPDPDAAVETTRSHYRVFSDITGFVWQADENNETGGRWVFAAVTIDGRTLRFDPATGDMVE